MEALNIFLKAAFIENMVLAYFLGMCSYLAVAAEVSRLLIVRALPTNKKLFIMNNEILNNVMFALTPDRRPPGRLPVVESEIRANRVFFKT